MSRTYTEEETARFFLAMELALSESLGDHYYQRALYAWKAKHYAYKCGNSALEQLADEAIKQLDEESEAEQ